MLFFLAATLHTTIHKAAKQSLLCEQVLKQHKIWHKKIKQDMDTLRQETKESKNDARAKELMAQEIAAIKTIRERIAPQWSDWIGDFFGKKTTTRRLQVRIKTNRMDEFLTKALEQFDELQAKFKNLPHKAYSGIYPEDPMVTQEAFCYRLILLFKHLADGHELRADGSSYLFEFDTLGFDFSGSIFCKDKTFIVPHQGYILSGQRLSQKHRWGPEDCTSLVVKCFPELPELGFSTLVLWAWINNDWKDLKDYEYMKPILDKVLQKTDVIEPGVLLTIKGHIWLVLGQEGDKLHVVSYRRSDWDLKSVGFIIESIDWPFPADKAYTILKPLF